MLLRDLKKLLLHPGGETEALAVEEEPSALSFLPAKVTAKPDFPLAHLRDRYSGTKTAGHFDLVRVVEGFVMDGNKKTWSFALPETAVLSDVAAVLGTAAESGFFLVGGDVFLDTGNATLLRNVALIVDRAEVAVRDFRTAIAGLRVDRGFAFFDGGRQLRFKVLRRVVVCDFRAKSLLHSLAKQRPRCRVCDRAEASVAVLDDPLLPRGHRAVCSACFDDLFRAEAGEEGALRFPGMRFKTL